MLHRIRITCFLLLAVLSNGLLAQQSYPVSDIPDSLIANANVVIREKSVDVNIEAQNSMTMRFKEVRTILKNSVTSNTIAMGYSYGVKVRKMSAVVYNSAGKEIKKINRKDFQDVSGTSSGSLYDDNRLKGYIYISDRYPITISFEYEIETGNTAFIPPFRIYEGFNTAIQKKEYSINCPKELGLRALERNFEGFEFEKEVSDEKYYYRAENFPAYKNEDFALDLDKFTPYTRFAIDNFHLEGVDGTASNWKEFGQWYFDKLLKEQLELPAEAIAEVKELTAGIEDEITRAKLVYEYVQKRSRYISIQLGIGGWKPFSAKSTHELGYGDCKALTNYTSALLGAVGVASNYCIVHAGYEKQSVESDFASIEGNHVFLCLPDLNAQDTVWLECTSQTSPFGYLGKFTDDRDVLLISDTGGKIVRSDSYDDEEHSLKTIAAIALNNNGSGSCSMKEYYRGDALGRYEIEQQDEEVIKNVFYRELGAFTNLDLLNYDFSNEDDTREFIETLEFTADNFAVVAGDDLLLPLIPVSNIEATPERSRDRKTPFEVLRNQVIKATFTFEMPEGFTVNDVPAEVSKTSAFGSYDANTKIEGTQLIHNRTFKLNKGVYEKEQFASFRSFLKSANKLERKKVLLEKIK